MSAAETGAAPGIADLAKRWLPEAQASHRARALEDARKLGLRYLRERLPAVVRVLGRAWLAAPVVDLADARIDLGSFRACDLVIAEILAEHLPHQAAGELHELYARGDEDERRAILKALPLLPLPPAAKARLVEEAHRTNDQRIFEAGILDSDLAARVLDDAAWNRIVLKTAFLDLPARRLYGWERRANRALAQMLRDFQAEREAAGRKVWADTPALVAAGA